MLPFSDLDFTGLAAFFVFTVLLAKVLLRRWLPYRHLLLGLSLFYLIFFFPKPFQLVGYILFSYGTIWLLANKYPKGNKLWGTVLLALPMIFLKAQWLTDWVTFAGLSYVSFRVIQVYMDHDNRKPFPNFLDFCNFLIFVPTLLIGPIDRFQRFQKDLHKGYANLDRTRWWSGWEDLLLGLFQKLVVAEAIQRYWLSELDPSSSDLWIQVQSIYAYGAYLYFDFAGYSSLAIGLGKMMGIDIPINFNHPYLAHNPKEFWKRWHKSLGDWLNDYFFRPIYKWLNGFKSLKSKPLLKQNLALFATFALMGLWNGFKAHFILSGCLFGLFSVVHNSYVYYSRKQGRDLVFQGVPEKVTRVISILVLVHLCLVAIYIFSGRWF